MPRVRFNALYPPDFVAEGRQAFAAGAPAPGTGEPRWVEVADARALQAREGLAEAEFFARHSFVLLPHVTAVRDWDAEGASVYGPEIEAVIHTRLLPGRRVQIHQGPVARRGRGTATPYYAEGVHSDGGLGPDDYANNIGAFAGEAFGRAWRAAYDADEVEGVIWIDFWRTTNMRGALEHMPLALCDAASLDASDLVPTAMTGIAPAGRETRHLGLRYNPGQRWLYYPRMTGDELLAFKLTEFWKSPSPPRNCFHTAFADPGAPADAEPRQSCEHRVGVMVLRD